MVVAVAIVLLALTHITRNPDGKGLRLEIQPTYNPENRMQLTTRIAYAQTRTQTNDNANEIGINWQPQTQINLKLSGEQTNKTNSIKLKAEVGF